MSGILKPIEIHSATQKLHDPDSQDCTKELIVSTSIRPVSQDTSVALFVSLKGPPPSERMYVCSTTEDEVDPFHAQRRRTTTTKRRKQDECVAFRVPLSVNSGQINSVGMLEPGTWLELAFHYLCMVQYLADNIYLRFGLI